MTFQRILQAQEILLNKIFGMCDNTQALLQHVNQVRRDPRLLRFALTVDNILKMVALYHRVTSGVPVVIMGESGCGKSAVVCFLAKFLRLRVFTLDVHGGLEEEDILKFMDEAETVFHDVSSVLRMCYEYAPVSYMAERVPPE